MNLYKYKEILQNINIVVIFSIPIISLILYTLNQRKIMLLQVMIYIGEIFIYLYLNRDNVIDSIVVHELCHIVEANHKKEWFDNLNMNSITNEVMSTKLVQLYINFNENDNLSF